MADSLELIEYYLEFHRYELAGYEAERLVDSGELPDSVVPTAQF